MRKTTNPLPLEEIQTLQLSVRTLLKAIQERVPRLNSNLKSPPGSDQGKLKAENPTWKHQLSYKVHCPITNSIIPKQ